MTTDDVPDDGRAAEPANAAAPDAAAPDAQDRGADDWYADDCYADDCYADDCYADRLDDEAWDRLGDAELTALAQSEPLPGPPAPWEPAYFPPTPARVYDRQLAVLNADGVGEFLRACRANAGLSQREVAEAAGLPQTTLARIEAGRSPGVRLDTVARLAEQCDVILVGTTGSHAPVIETDHAQRHRDAGDRLLPAHLFNAPYISEANEDARRVGRALPARTYHRTRVRDVPDD